MIRRIIFIPLSPPPSPSPSLSYSFINPFFPILYEIGISQRDHSNYYDFLKAMKNDIKDSIIKFYSERIHQQFFDETCILSQRMPILLFIPFLILLSLTKYHLSYIRCISYFRDESIFG